MTDFIDNTPPLKATFRDYLSQPAFADELENFASGGETTDLFSFTDMEGLFDHIFSGDWQEDKFSLECIADHLRFYAHYLGEICNMSPDTAPTPEQAAAFARKMGELYAKRMRLTTLKSRLDNEKENLDLPDAA